MRTKPLAAIVWLLLSPLVAGSPRAEETLVFETKFCRAELGEDAVWRSLIAIPGGRALLPSDRQTAIATVQLDGKSFAANSARREKDRLVVGFAGIDTRLEYTVEEADDWITFRLDRITGPRPQRITFVRIGTTLTEHVGLRLNGAWDPETAVILRGVIRQALCRPSRRDGWTELTAEAQDEPGPKLEGTGAALVVVPTAGIRPVMARLAERYGLPTNTTADGVASKDTDNARGSYWFLSFAENQVDQVIDCCRKTGFRQVMIDSGAWCTSSGHYLFNKTRYPDGLESLRRTVERLHQAGILVGMHCFASKVSKVDPYVTPVPDRRFLADLTAVLAEGIAADSTMIRTSSDLGQWPGSQVARQKVWEGGVDKHREVVIDNEIIQYESIGPEGAWNTFLGCRRGAWGTQPAEHGVQAECRHLAVDGCINGYIIDQETDLLDEVTGRLAEVFNT
ncbi:MAG: WYL domain-containing protein, partial [Thermoguttaceae bacterium]